MTQALIKGSFQAKPIKAELGNNKKGAPELRIDFQIVGGDYDGQRVPYSGLFTEKAVKYTKRAMRALGWQGETVKTAPDDIMGKPATVPIEVTVAEWTNPDTGELRQWSTVRNVGTYSEPLKPLDKSTLKDVDSWLKDADGDSTPF